MARPPDDNKDNTDVKAVLINRGNRRKLIKTKGMGHMLIDPGASVPLTRRQADLVGDGRPQDVHMEKYNPDKHGPKKKDL
jgi:hypothetical protein